MTALLEFPFPLPDRFLDALGYSRVVEAFESPAMCARLADLLRREGFAEAQPMPTGPRRYVMLNWESADDELAFTDGVHSGAGQLDHWLFLQVLHRPQVHGWLAEHQVDLGSSDAPATHALVVDADSGVAAARAAPSPNSASARASHRSPPSLVTCSAVKCARIDSPAGVGSTNHGAGLGSSLSGMAQSHIGAPPG
jgi:hypothetical protein